jgi:hypothetical protein
MAYQFQQTNRGNHDAAWLSMLVGTMEKLSAPGGYVLPCDKASLMGAEAHLARPMPRSVCAAKVEH